MKKFFSFLLALVGLGIVIFSVVTLNSFFVVRPEEGVARFILLRCIAKPLVSVIGMALFAQGMIGLRRDERNWNFPTWMYVLLSVSYMVTLLFHGGCIISGAQLKNVLLGIFSLVVAGLIYYGLLVWNEACFCNKPQREAPISDNTIQSKATPALEKVSQWSFGKTMGCVGAMLLWGAGLALLLLFHLKWYNRLLSVDTFSAFNIENNPNFGLFCFIINPAFVRGVVISTIRISGYSALSIGGWLMTKMIFNAPREDVNYYHEQILEKKRTRKAYFRFNFIVSLLLSVAVVVYDIVDKKLWFVFLGASEPWYFISMRMVFQLLSIGFLWIVLALPYYNRKYLYINKSGKGPRLFRRLSVLYAVLYMIASSIEVGSIRWVLPFVGAFAIVVAFFCFIAYGKGEPSSDYDDSPRVIRREKIKGKLTEYDDGTSKLEVEISDDDDD